MIVFFRKARYYCCCRCLRSTETRPESTAKPATTADLEEYNEDNIGELNVIYGHFKKEYQIMEHELLTLDFDSNIPFVHIIRQNPEVILKRGAKYSSHILELAKKRKHMLVLKERLARSGSLDDSKDDHDDEISESMVMNPFHDLNRFSSQGNDRESISMRLSSRWSKRLGDISVNNKLKPKWPDFLMEVTFDVVKQNRVGQYLPRKVKLTKYHILNMRSDGVLTKAYLYTEVRRVLLDDGNNLSIDLKNGKRLHWCSHLASHIVQQIITRIKFRLQLDRSSFLHSGQTSSMNLSSSVSIIEQISQENSLGASDAIFSFAEELCQNFMANKDGPNNNNNNNNANLESEEEKIAEEKMVVNLAEDEDADTPIATGSESESKKIELTEVVSSSVASLGNAGINLMAISENSSEFLVQKMVQQMIYNPNTPEGNTRNLFLSNLINSKDKSKKNVQEIRDFIDGMHDHILNTHGSDLVIQYRYRNSQNVNFYDENGTAKQADYFHSLEEKKLTSLIFLVYKVIEDSVLVPLLDVITSLFTVTINSTEEVLVSRIQATKNRSQDRWGVPAEFISPLNWQSAIFEMSHLENNVTPTDMLNILARTAKAIYSEFKFAVIPKLGKNDVFLGADDFVPIFIYVFSRSGIKRPVLMKDIMWNLSHPSLLHGECGYYLTVFESAIEYVLNDTLLPEENLEFEDSFSACIAKREASKDFQEQGNDSNGAIPSVILFTRSPSLRNKKEILRESFV